MDGANGRNLRGARHALALAFAICVASWLPGAALAQETAAPAKCPPLTPTVHHVEEMYHVALADPYRWLEDQNSPETRAWIAKEDECTAAVLNAVPERDAIEKRLTELMKVDAYSLPIIRPGMYFFSRRGADQELFVTYKRLGLNGADEVLIDPHPLSADHSASASLISLSRDGSLAAYRVRAGGQDEVTVHFMDTSTRQDLPDQLPHGDYFSVAIEPSKKGAYYTLQTPRGTRVFHHLMGTDPSKDEVIFGKEYGRDKILIAQLSDDGRDLLINVVYGSGSQRSDLYCQRLDRGEPIRPLVNDLDSVFSGQMGGGYVFVRTNWKAPNWRIMRVDLDHPDREHWKEVVPESDAAIQSFSPGGGKLLVRYIRNAFSQVKIFDADGAPAGELPLPGIGSVPGISSRWESDEVFFSFESFNVPESIYRYSLPSHAIETWVAPKVPVDSKAYTVEQVWYESKDKTRIPMFLLHKNGLARDGARPTWLTAYGGFDVSLTPEFSASAIAWVDRGGVFAMPNLRGGGEFGEAWHHAGMLEKKQNVFDDFIAAAEWLIANKYTKPQKLAISGASNGGLLVGAALTQRPSLFGAVVCEYPLLDMLRYHLFLQGPFWVPEYGSAADPAQFKYLLAYSPYQNVRAGTKYPAVLFVTGDGDTRVAPLHARKMAALLQSATGSNHPVLLLYDTKSGHSGGRPLNKEIEESTDILSFLHSQLGVE
jgi:prolyl oligopeptidase